MLDVDHVARALGGWGRKALSMPCGAFEADGQSHPLVALGGHALGKIIPGHGLLLPADLKTLGITKKIPGVIERTPFMRMRDALAGDRGLITSLADVIALPRHQYVKTDTFTVNTGSNSYVSQQFSNFNTTAGFNASGNVAPTRTSLVGAYNAASKDPTPGKKRYLVGISVMSNTSTAVNFAMGIYADILSTWGNIDSTLATLQTISMAALTRYTTGVGVYLFISSTNVGTSFPSTTTCTIGYTNQGGTAGQATTFSVLANSPAFCGLAHDSNATDFEYLATPLGTGDFGVQAVASAQFSQAATAPGLVGGMLYHPLLFMHGIPEPFVTVERDVRAEPEILVEFGVDVSGVLGYHSIIWSSASTVSPTITFTFDTCEG